MAVPYTEWQFQLVNKRTGRPVDDDSGQYIAYTVNTPVKATLYSDKSGTALTQPGTMSNGAVRFWTDSSVTTLDLTILTSTGRSYWIETLAPSQHRVDVDPEKSEYTLEMGWAIKSAHADGLVSALGFQLQNGMVIHRVYVQKQSVGEGVSTGLVLDFGVSGDPDGFIDGISSTVTGYNFVPALLTAASGSAAAGEIVMAAQNRGALLVNFNAGFSITETLGRSKGYFLPKPYVASLVTTTNNLVFAITGTSSLTTVAGSQGYVFYEYRLVPTAGN